MLASKLESGARFADLPTVKSKTCENVNPASTVEKPSLSSDPSEQEPISLRPMGGAPPKSNEKINENEHPKEEKPTRKEGEVVPQLFNKVWRLCCSYIK